MNIVIIPSGFAVMTSAGSVVGFAATLEIAKKLKASAEANASAVAELEKQGVSLGW